MQSMKITRHPIYDTVEATISTQSSRGLLSTPPLMINHTRTTRHGAKPASRQANTLSTREKLVDSTNTLKSGTLGTRACCACEMRQSPTLFTSTTTMTTPPDEHQMQRTLLGALHEHVITTHPHPKEFAA